MKDKFNQFVDNVNGQFVEVSYKKALYQCMDLAYAWVFCLGFPKATIQHLYAYQVYTNPTDLTKKYFDLIPNTLKVIPQDGDIVVWKKTSSNIAGHIAIALSGGTTKSCRYFEQNNPLGTHAHIQSRSYKNVLGWLRPKGKIISGIYKGIDLNNRESVKVCVDTWKDVTDGKFIKKENYDRIKKDCENKLAGIKSQQKEKINNVLTKAKKDWGVVKLQSQVQEHEKFRKTTAYKVAVTIAEILQTLKIVKKEIKNGSTRLPSEHKRSSK